MGGVSVDSPQTAGWIYAHPITDSQENILPITTTTFSESRRQVAKDKDKDKGKGDDEDKENVKMEDSDSRKATERRVLLQNNAKTFAYYTGLYENLFDENAGLGDVDISSDEDGSEREERILEEAKKENEKFETLLSEVKSILKDLDSAPATTSVASTEGREKTNNVHIVNSASKPSFDRRKTEKVPAKK